MKIRQSPSWSTRGLTFVALLASCRGALDIEPPVHDDSSPGGSAGSGGSRAGSPAGGSAGEAGDAGTSGMDASEGGRPTGGSGSGSAGNEAGRSTGGGYGGEGGEPEWPEKGEPCKTPGSLACAAPASKESLICDAGAWREREERCGSFQLCDRNTGSCAAEQCRWDACDNFNNLLRCGPDRVNLRVEECLFGCNEAEEDDSCVAPEGRQLIVDRPPEISDDWALWPDPVIPVCVRSQGPAAEVSNIVRVIQDQIDATYGRYAALAFVGWEACAEDARRIGIEIDLVDDCEGELLHVERLGSPGPERSLKMSLCRSYRDFDPATDDPQIADDELLRFMALHAFGHALGLKDERYDQDRVDFMMYGVALPVAKHLRFDAPRIDWLSHVQGYKSSHRVVGTTGRCLAPSADGFEQRPCDGAPDLALRSTGGRLQHGTSGRCLAARADAAPALAECVGDDAAQVWAPRRVRWLANLWRCVSVRSSPPAGTSPLVAQDCDPTWPSAQAFAFEFDDANRVRIRAADGRCVRVPAAIPGQAFPSIPALGACDGTRDLFEAHRMRLEFEGHCLMMNDAEMIGISHCNDYYRFFFSLSGAFENGAGQALTFQSDTGLLSTSGARRLPLDEQTFDYYF